MKLEMIDYLIIGVLVLFGFLPDPTDLFDAFLPVLEWGSAIGYLLLRRFGGLKI